MVITGGPIAALLVLVLAVVIIGNSGFTRTMKQVKEAGRLAQIVEEAKFLSARFERVRPGSTTYEDVIAATQRWHAQSLHELLDMAKDSRLSPTTRSDAIRNVGRLLETSSQFAKVVPKSRNKAIEALLPLLNQPIESLRNEALGALRALGVDDEWLILEHTDARSAQKEKR